MCCQVTKIKGFLRLSCLPFSFYGHWIVRKNRNSPNYPWELEGRSFFQGSDAGVQPCRALTWQSSGCCLLRACSRVYGLISHVLPLSCSWSATSHWMNRVFWGSNCSSRAALHFTPASRFKSTKATYKQEERGSRSCVQLCPTKPRDTQAKNKQDAPFLDLRMGSSKFGFSASQRRWRSASEPGALQPSGLGLLRRVGGQRSPYLGAMV